jgi:hypothetical protein
MSETSSTDYRTPLLFIVGGVLIAAATALADLLGISEPGVGEWQWVSLCLAGILTILGLAILLAALPDR